MFISDLNYLETASEAITGGFFGFGDSVKVKVYQSNENYTYQDADAKAYGKYYVKANASNENYTYQENYIGKIVAKA